MIKWPNGRKIQWGNAAMIKWSLNQMNKSSNHIIFNLFSSMRYVTARPFVHLNIHMYTKLDCSSNLWITTFVKKWQVPKIKSSHQLKVQTVKWSSFWMTELLNHQMIECSNHKIYTHDPKQEKINYTYDEEVR